MEDSMTSFTNKKIWFSNYGYCNNVSDKAEHNIATETRSLYLYWIGEIYNETLSELTKKLLINPKTTKQYVNELVSDLSKKANDKFFSLSYLFPYSSIEIIINFPAPNIKSENYIYIFNKKGIVSFDICDNNFFPKPSKEFQMYDITTQSIISIFEIRQRRVEDYTNSLFNLTKQAKGDSIH
jgi:hypothetical protein